MVSPARKERTRHGVGGERKCHESPVPPRRLGLGLATTRLVGYARSVKRVAARHHVLRRVRIRQFRSTSHALHPRDLLKNQRHIPIPVRIVLSRASILVITWMNHSPVGRTKGHLPTASHSRSGDVGVHSTTHMLWLHVWIHCACLIMALPPFSQPNLSNTPFSHFVCEVVEACRSRHPLPLCLWCLHIRKKLK